MATPLPIQPIVSKSNFHNWIKSALAVLITKEEIEPVVYNEIVKFQQKCLQDITTSNSLPTGSTCNNCCTENLVKCPTYRICNLNKGKCSYHGNAATYYLGPTGCPNKICHHLKSEIKKAHRYNGPSFKNTDAKQWCSNPWEIAKCYMPLDGYKDVTHATDTDFNGIVSVIINHKEFGTKTNNIFNQGREVGKAVRHSPNLEVEDTDLTKYFTILNNILTDPVFKAINKPPHNAIHKLKQLQNNDFIICEDVRKVLKDVGQEHINHHIFNYEKTMKALNDAGEDKLTAIKNQGNVSIEDLNKKLESSVDYFKELLQDSIKQIMNETRKGKNEIIKEKERALKEIVETKESGTDGAIVKTTEEKYKEQKQGGSDKAVVKTAEEKYQKQKQELKFILTKFYNKKQSTVCLSPLLEEKETYLAGFYVMPNMIFIKQKSCTSHEMVRTPVRSLSDLLVTGNEVQQNIYVSAEAGIGKTSFSKYLAITWSQSCCPDKKMECFKDDEIALAKFDFLFLILLRDCTDVCSVDDMIEKQIIKKLPRSDSQYPLREVLEREKCLIILDGLDEWTHPCNKCPYQDEKIPHRYKRDNCIILTTTRPWKLQVLKLETLFTTKKVELVKLSKYSTRQLEKNIISKMSNVKDDGELEQKTWEFHQDIVSRGLENMQTIPRLLMYITCLWCRKILIGNSKVEVYINIIEYLISKTVNRFPEIHPSSETTHSDIPEFFKKFTYQERKCQTAPTCKKEHLYCQEFYSVLGALAELAYHTYFNENREKTLVFDQSVAEQCLVADDMKFSLLSGILTGSTTRTLMEESSKVSFLDKSVQEFFAALFISSQSDGERIVLEKCTNVQSLLDMSMIFEFLSKMNPKMMNEIFLGLMSVINEDDETRKYTGTTGYISNEPLYHIQKMLLSCLKEMPESENIKLCLQDFFINEDTIHDTHLQRLSKQNHTNMKSLYINIRNTSSSLPEVIALFSFTYLINLHTLCFNGDRNKEAEFSLLLYENLQHIRLSSAEWTNYGGNLCERITALQHVQYLDISHIRVPHEIRELLYDFMSNNKTIKRLGLEDLSCKEHQHDCPGYFNLSIGHSQLEKLSLYGLPPLNVTLTSQSLVEVELSFINVGESSILLSRDMFNIKRVVLLEIMISANKFRDFIDVVEKLPQSVTVVMFMCDIKPEGEYEHVRKYIRRSQKFDVTRDEKISSGLEVFQFQTTTRSSTTTTGGARAIQETTMTTTI